MGQSVKSLDEVRKLLLEARLVYDNTSGGDGAEGELRLLRMPDFAHDHDVERRTQRARNLVRHGYASARKGEHEYRRSQDPRL